MFIELLPRMAIPSGSTSLVFGQWGVGSSKGDVVFSVQPMLYQMINM
jgi:hypothetical protein